MIARSGAPAMGCGCGVFGFGRDILARSWWFQVKCSAGQCHKTPDIDNLPPAPPYNGSEDRDRMSAERRLRGDERNLLRG